MSMPPTDPTDTSGALLTAVCPVGVRKVTAKGVLKPGSSKQGKAERASIDSNWLQPYQSGPTLTRNRPEALSL